VAITPGQKFIRRQSAARTNVSNTAVADFSLDTAVTSEGGFGTWGSNEVTVDTIGRYLVIHGTGEVDTSGTTREVGTNSIVVDGTSQDIHGLTTHRYVRNAGGAEEAVSLGVGIVDATAGTEAIGSRIDGSSFADSRGDFDMRADHGAGIQIIALGTGNFLELERTSNQSVALSNINTTRPWLESSGVWSKITFPTENHDEGGWHAAASGDVVLPASSKFLVSWSVQFTNTDASRQSGIARLNIGGTSMQYSSAYHRNTAAQGCVAQGLMLWETGGATETLYVEATQEQEGTDGGTLNCQRASLQIIELPASAEWIHVDNGATDSQTTDLAGTTTWYKSPLSSTYRADGNSRLSLDGTNDGVQNDSGGSLSVLAIGWLNWDRDSGSSATRKVPASTFAANGTNLTWGWGGAYNRGAQSNDDCFHSSYMAAAATDLASAADLTLETRDRANSSNVDMGVYAGTGSNRHFLGIQVLDLTTLDAAEAQTVGLDTPLSVAPTILNPTVTNTPASQTVGIGSGRTDPLAVIGSTNLHNWFKFDDASGNPADSSTNSNPVTSIFGTPTYQAEGPYGSQASSLAIELSSGKVLTVADANTPASDAADMTLATWVNVTALAADTTDSDDPDILMISTGTFGSTGFRFWLGSPSDGPITQALYFTSGLDGASQAVEYDFGSSLDNLGWQHVAVRYTAATKLAELFVSGVEVASGTLTNAVNDAADDWKINNYYLGAGGDASFTAEYSDMVVIETTASDADILSLYEGDFTGPALALTVTINEPTVTGSTPVAFDSPLAVAPTINQLTVAPGVVTVAMDSLSVPVTPAAAAVDYTVALNALTVPETINDLTVTPKAVTVAFDTPLSVAPTILQPSVAVGAVTVAMEVYSVGGPIIPNFTVAPGAVTVALDTLAVAPTILQTTIVPGAVTVALDTLAVAPTILQPTVTIGAVTVALDSLSIPVTPASAAVAQTAALNTLAVAPTILQPTVTTVTSVAFDTPLAVAPTINQLTVGYAVALDALTVAPTINEFTVVAESLVGLDSLSIAETILPFDVTYTVALNVLPVAPTINDLTVSTGASTIALEALSSPPTILDLTVTTGAVTVALEALSSPPTILQPTVTPGAVTIGFDTPLAVAPTINNLTVTAVATVTFDTPLAIAPTILQPTIATGAITVAMDSLSIPVTPASAAVAQTVALDVLSVAETIYDPTVTTVTSVSLETLTVPPTVSEMTISVGSVTVALETLSIVETVLQPTVSVDAATVGLEVLSVTETIQNLDLAYEVQLDSLSVAPSILQPTVGYTVELATLSAAPAVLSLAVGYTVALDAVAIPPVIRQPTVAPGAVAVALETLPVSVVIPNPGAGVTIALDALSVSVGIREPAVTTDTYVGLDSLTAAPTILDPTVTTGAVTVGLAAAALTISINQPTVTAGQISGLQTVSVAETIHSPTVDYRVELQALSAAPTINNLQVDYQIALSVLALAVGIKTMAVAFIPPADDPSYVAAVIGTVVVTAGPYGSATSTVVTQGGSVSSESLVGGVVHTGSTLVGTSEVT